MGGEGYLCVPADKTHRSLAQQHLLITSPAKLNTLFPPLYPVQSSRLALDQADAINGQVDQVACNGARLLEISKGHCTYTLFHLLICTVTCAKTGKYLLL